LVGQVSSDCCGAVVSHDASYCSTCGAAIPAHVSDDRGATGFLDTVRLAPAAGEPEDERVVRPSLAIMFRLAVGPRSDHYAPRFMEFERVGHSMPGWNWASLWAPSAWAFYRKLWVAGIAFALWPLLAVAAFSLIEPHLGDSAIVWLACAVLLIWLVPGAVASLIGDTLVWRDARRRVREAQELSRSPQDTAKMLAKHTAIAPASAVFLGGSALLLAGFTAWPSVHSAYADRVVRTHIAEVIAIALPLQQQVEQWAESSKPARIPPKKQNVAVQPHTDLIDELDVSLVNGRVRVTLGPLVPELYGRSILLAPALDRFQQLRWICVPVGIPSRYLPAECRKA
jgi:hypothetical protein